MHQIKLFKGLESDVAGLESDINDWLRESSASVVNIFGNIAAQTPRGDKQSGLGGAYGHSDIFIAVLHETS